LHPVFLETEFTKRVHQVVDSLKEEKDEPNQVIGKYFRAFLFGAHPYGRPIDGDETSLSQLVRADVARFYAQGYRPDTTILAVAGDFSAPAMRRQIESRFGAWTSPPPSPPRALPAPALVSGRRLLLVDKPDSTQTYFRIGNLGIDATNQDRVTIELVNTVFGGRFTSLLNDALRVNSGYTYGAGSRFEPSALPGPFYIASYTRNDTTVPAIDLALQVLARLHSEGLTSDQIASGRAYLKGQAPERLETSAQLAARLARLEAYGMDTREIDEYYRRLDAVSAADAQRVIRDYFPLDNLVFVLIGKASEIKSAVGKYAPQVELRDISQPGYAAKEISSPSLK
jgi:zinc protease